MTSHLRNDRAQVLRRALSLGIVVTIALVALVGIGRLAQAQPVSLSPEAGAVQRSSLASAHETRPEAPAFNLLYSENFEGGFDGWQASGSTGPRWNIVQSGSPFPKPAGGPSGANAVWFGDPVGPPAGQYGGTCLPASPCPRYAGTLTYVGPPIQVPSNVSYTYMTFMSWELTEKSFSWGCTPGDYGTPYCQADVRQVWISGTSDSIWRLKWSTQQQPIVEQIWRAVGPIDLSEYKGQSIRIRFGFDTVDLIYNPGDPAKIPAGWYVDNILVFTFTPTDRIYLPQIRRNSSG